MQTIFSKLNERWRIPAVFELPLAYTNRNSADGEFKFGIGYVVAQVLGIGKIDERTAMVLSIKDLFLLRKPQKPGRGPISACAYGHGALDVA